MIDTLNPLLSFINSSSGKFMIEEILEKAKFEAHIKKILYSKTITAFIRRLPIKKKAITKYVKTIDKIEPMVFEKGEIKSYVSGRYKTDKQIEISRFAPGLYVQNISAINRI